MKNHEHDSSMVLVCNIKNSIKSNINPNKLMPLPPSDIQYICLHEISYFITNGIVS